MNLNGTFYLGTELSARFHNEDGDDDREETGLCNGIRNSAVIDVDQAYKYEQTFQLIFPRRYQLIVLFFQNIKDSAPPLQGCAGLGTINQKLIVDDEKVLDTPYLFITSWPRVGTLSKTVILSYFITTICAIVAYVCTTAVVSNFSFVSNIFMRIRLG